MFRIDSIQERLRAITRRANMLRNHAESTSDSRDHRLRYIPPDLTRRYIDVIQSVEVMTDENSRRKFIMICRESLRYEIMVAQYQFR